VAKISYSQFGMWSQCPQRWKLNYVDNMRDFTGNIHTIFGSAIHTVIQEYLTTFFHKTIKEADSIDVNSRLLEELKIEFNKAKEQNSDENFVPCSKEDLGEFYNDGVSLLDWFKKRKGQYFNKRGYELLGIEMPLNYKMSNAVNFIGFMDVVLKDTVRDRIKIIDIKTSTKGWNKYENVDFPQKKVQLFTPANGKPSMNKVLYRLKDFIDDCFDEDGNYLLKEYRAEASKKNCRFCEFNQTEHCDKGIK
jgi:hypothetical protein